MTYDSTRHSRLAAKGTRMNGSGSTPADMGVVLAVIAGVLVMIVGGVIVKIVRDHIGMSPNRDLQRSSTPPKGELVRVCFAAVVKARRLRDIGATTGVAAKLFSEASLRWAGAEALWANKCDRMGIKPIDTYPQNEDWDVVVAFTAILPENAIPQNRLNMRAVLKNAAENNTLKYEGLYDCPLALDPLRFGFQAG